MKFDNTLLLEEQHVEQSPSILRNVSFNFIPTTTTTTTTASSRRRVDIGIILLCGGFLVLLQFLHDELTFQVIIPSYRREITVINNHQQGNDSTTSSSSISNDKIKDGLLSSKNYNSISSQQQQQQENENEITKKPLNWYSYQQHIVGKHHHKIPPVIIVTHRENFLTSNFPPPLPPSNNKSQRKRDRTLKEREMYALQQNVFDIIKTHPESTIRFLTDNDCIVSIRNAMNDIYGTTNKTNTELMVQYFINEPEGMYKADICRGAALYETGGLYFDVDIGVRASLWNYILPKTEFVTVKALADFPGNAGGFFQAFMGCTKRHPVIRRYIELFFHYYSGYLPEAADKFLGPYLLGRAYDEILIEQTVAKSSSLSSLVTIGDTKTSANERWLRYKVKDHTIIQDLKTNNTKISIMANRTKLHRTSELWEEVRYNEKLMKEHVPVPNWGNHWVCAVVIAIKYNATYVDVPMYSRIADSRGCLTE